MEIKKPLNAFLMYRREISAQIKKEHPLATIGEISTITGKRWSEETSETKLKYKEMAKRAFQEHKNLHPDFIWPSRNSAERRKKQREKNKIIMKKDLNVQTSTAINGCAKSPSGSPTIPSLELGSPCSGTSSSPCAVYCSIHGRTVLEDHLSFPEICPVCPNCVSDDIKKITAIPGQNISDFEFDCGHNKILNNDSKVLRYLNDICM
jgi:hypothetical protein